MKTIFLNCSITFYKYLPLVEIGDTRLGKNKPLETTAFPIVVVVVVDAVIPNIMGEKLG